MLAGLTRHRPAVLLLDDLHWAGAQTLALLRHLARTGSAHRLLVIATFRDTGDEITDPLAAVSRRPPPDRRRHPPPDRRVSTRPASSASSPA